MPRQPKNQSLRLTPTCIEVYTLKVVLQNTGPPILRTFEISDAATLTDLHEALQIVMGWTNSHLHSFETKEGRRYQAACLLQEDFAEIYGEEILDADKIVLASLKDELAEKIIYEYDFGDGWTHIVELIGVRESEEDEPSLPRCLDGQLACPPEDCGGVCGYYDLIAALNDPEDEEHEAMMAWCGDYDPEAFDADEVNQQLKQGTKYLGHLNNPPQFAF